jgi:hypothetical protein
MTTAGQPVSSGFRGKPVLVSFVYTGCFDVAYGSVALYKPWLRCATDSASINCGRLHRLQPADRLPLAMRDFRRAAIKDQTGNSSAHARKT